MLSSIYFILYFSGFGDQELQVFMEHFGEVFISAGIAADELEYEWTLLKTEMHNE